MSTSIIMQAPSKKTSGPAEVVILTANVKCAVEWYTHISKLQKYQVIFEIFGKFLKIFGARILHLE